MWLDQERASQAVTHLSDLMRYLTYSSRQKKVGIREEIAHLDQLVELQRLRMSNDKALTFTYDIDGTNQTIAPLMMMPLVENCFKHCGNIDEDGAIRISLTLKDGEMTFTTDNNLPADEATIKDKKKGGIGLVVLRRRLSLIYPDRYVLLNESKDRRYVTVLRIIL